MKGYMFLKSNIYIKCLEKHLFCIRYSLNGSDRKTVLKYQKECDYEAVPPWPASGFSYFEAGEADFALATPGWRDLSLATSTRKGPGQQSSQTRDPETYPTTKNIKLTGISGIYQ